MAASFLAGKLPDTAAVCSCNNVTKGDIVEAVKGGCSNIGDLKTCTKAGAGCGDCVPLATSILNYTLEDMGIEVDTSIASTSLIHAKSSII